MIAIRKIDNGQMTVTPVSVDSPTTTWFQSQAGESEWTLLAFADDGLIWGKLQNGTILLSGDNFPEFSPLWRFETLQEARLFNERAEIHLWRTGDGWQARRITDDDGEPIAYYDESQILWGNTHHHTQNGFTAVSDGSLGFRHAVPIAVDETKFGNEKNKRRPLRLTVRHYLTQGDTTGIITVTLSRLVEVEAE